MISEAQIDVLAQNFLPENFNVRARGCCILAAYIIGRKLVAQGVDFDVREGWIQFIDEDGSMPEDVRFAHTWIEAGGKIVDPTIEQFHEHLAYYHFARDISLSTPGLSYLSDAILNTEHPEIFFDGDIPPDVLSWLSEAKISSSEMSI